MDLLLSRVVISPATGSLVVLIISLVLQISILLVPSYFIPVGKFIAHHHGDTIAYKASVWKNAVNIPQSTFSGNQLCLISTASKLCAHRPMRTINMMNPNRLSCLLRTVHNAANLYFSIILSCDERDFLYNKHWVLTQATYHNSNFWG